MSKNQKNNKSKKKAPFSVRFRKFMGTKKATKIFIAILAVPVLIFGFNIVTAEIGKSKPVVGSRFEDNLDPKISKDQLKELESVLKDESYEDMEVLLKVATLRVYIQTNQDVSSEQMQGIAKDAYAKVTKVLPVKEYFQIINNKQKQYDLEIHVYNSLDEDKDESFRYYVYSQASSMPEPKGQMLSSPKDPEFAEKVKQHAADVKKAKEAEKKKEAKEDNKGKEEKKSKDE